MNPIKKIFAPHLGRHVKLGRRRPVSRGPRLSLKNYIDFAKLPPFPGACDYSSGGGSVLRDVMLNDALGDCVIAAGYHMLALMTGAATDIPFSASQDQLIADYSAIGGYVPGDPSTDNGCNEIDALNYWQSHGFADGSKLIGSVLVDATNRDEVRAALYLFENLFFGVELPDGWISPFPSADNFVWDNASPDPNNGHAFLGIGYDSVGVKIDTWGLFGTVTYAAIADLCCPSSGGELHVLLSPDQLAAGAFRAPNGIAWNDLLDDFRAIGGDVPPAPPIPPPLPPEPPTPPAPPPAGVTLEQAIAWATGGLEQNWPK